MRRIDALGALALVAGTTGMSWPARADTAAIRVGNVPMDANSNLLSAYAEGFFTKAGLSIELEETKNGTAGAAALIAGSLDISNINIASLIAARQKNIPFTIVALGVIYTGKAGHAIVVPKDSPVTSARDLMDRTVGVNAIGGGLDWLATRAYVDKNGGDSNRVRFTEMPFSIMPEALNARRVDAAFLLEPFLSVAKRSGHRILAPAYDAISPTFLVSAFVTTADWGSAHADVARRYNDAMHQASIWANHHQDKTAEILSKFTNVEVASLRTVARATFSEGQQDLVALVQPVIDAVSKYGLSPVTVSAADLFSKEVFHLS